jgi:hypothetical protein
MANIRRSNDGLTKCPPQAEGLQGTPKIHRMPGSRASRHSEQLFK